MKKLKLLSLVLSIFIVTPATVMAMHRMYRHSYPSCFNSYSSPSPSPSPSPPNSGRPTQYPVPLFVPYYSHSASHSPSPTLSNTIEEKIFLMKRKIYTSSHLDVHTILEDFEHLITEYNDGEHAKENMESIIRFLMEFLDTITDRSLNDTEISDLGRIIFLVAGIPDDIVPDKLFKPMCELSQYLITKRD